MNKDKKKIGLALSGGGYRAAAYHVGTLRALHKLGILNKVDVISSVSGGSITTAYYALHKDDYQTFEQGFIARLQRGVLWSSFLYVGVLGILVLAFAVVLGYITALVMGTLWPHHPIWAGSVAAFGRRMRISPCAFGHLEKLVYGLAHKQTHFKTLR
jgi:phospholipase, patatin family